MRRAFALCCWLYWDTTLFETYILMVCLPAFFACFSRLIERARERKRVLSLGLGLGLYWPLTCDLYRWTTSRWCMDEINKGMKNHLLRICLSVGRYFVNGSWISARYWLCLVSNWNAGWISISSRIGMVPVQTWKIGISQLMSDWNVSSVLLAVEALERRDKLHLRLKLL